MMLNVIKERSNLHNERTKVVRTILCEPVATDFDTIAANTIIQYYTAKQQETKLTTIYLCVGCCCCVLGRKARGCAAVAFDFVRVSFDSID